MSTAKSIGVALLALLGVAACGDPVAAPSGVVVSEPMDARDIQTFWRQALPDAQPPEGQLVSTETRDGKTTSTYALPLRPRGERPGRDHLDGIRLAPNAPKQEVRRYVARVLRAAQRVRRSYSPRDPEVEMLASIGGERVDVLLEPLVHLDHVAAEIHLVAAIGRLAEEAHNELILESLPDVHGLVAVVVSKGWTEEAAPTLLRALAKRSKYMRPDWVTAAAQVARPQHYDDLRFQMAEGQDPAGVWMAIRDLPGMEPLDEFVAKTWRSATEQEYHHRWYELAVIAAHYGHVDALEPFARRLPQTRRWWGLFQSLTGFGQGRTDPGRYADALAWVVAHEDDLVFDRAEQRYHLTQR